MVIGAAVSIALLLNERNALSRVVAAEADRAHSRNEAEAARQNEAEQRRRLLSDQPDVRLVHERTAKAVA